MSEQNKTGSDGSLSKCLCAIAEHFEAIETLMVEMKAYSGAEKAKEAAEAFRRTKTLLEFEQISDTYFNEHEKQANK